MITFTYNPVWDLRWLVRNIKNRNFLRKIRVTVFPFRLYHCFIVIKSLRKSKPIAYTHSVKVYFLTSGTTGAYTYPDKIFICPVSIEKFGGLARVLSHELAHLELGKNMENLPHFEKEKKVRDLERKILSSLENKK